MSHDRTRAGWSAPRVDVRVDVLGPLQLHVAGGPVTVPGPKRRAVLALLALAEGRLVTVDHLVDSLWPDSLPESGRQALHSHVFRLRGHLGEAADRLQTPPHGYRLDLATGDLDLTEARAALSASRGRPPAEGYAALRHALSLWRGPVLADLLDVEPVAAAVLAIEQLRQEVGDAVVRSGVAGGLGHEVLALATAAVTEDPLRESGVLLAMQALAATGDPLEALRLGREFRARLADETGLDPTPALSELERRVAGGSAGPVPGSSPKPRTPVARLVGRETHVAALHRLLAEERLVTVAGPGGVGKTRLAMEIAARTEPVTVLSLTSLTDAAALPLALAAALQLEVVSGDVTAASAALLATENRLLVVDNCEHLLGAVRDLVAVLLARCPRLGVLATSREPLGLTVEHVFRLPPLALPQRGTDVSRAPSVEVFFDRAARVRPELRPTPADLRVVAGIVRRLDGMPLAIELAAGRLSTLSLVDLSRRLDRSLDLLGDGRPSADARHRTLRATVEWSYDLLSPTEQLLFRRLAAFPDGLDLTDAETLAATTGIDDDAATVLARLVDASMLEVSFEGGTRYRMLHTLRAFGLDRLAAAGETEVSDRHLLDWATRRIRWIDATLATEDEARADRELRREIANLRAAWRLARSSGARDEAVAMVTGLYDAITYRDLTEIRGWAVELASDPGLSGHPGEAAVLGTAAEACYHAGDHDDAERLALAGLDRATDAESRWICLSPLAVVRLARGEFADVVETALRAAPVRPRENYGIAAMAAAYAGDIDRARELSELQRRLPLRSPTLRAWATYVTAEIETAAGDRRTAEPLYEEAIELAREVGATFLVGVATVGLVAARADAGRVTEALRGFQEVTDYFDRTGNLSHLWVALRNLAVLLRRLGETDAADLLDAAADRAPDAPPVRRGAREDATSAADRRDALTAARAAVARCLARQPG